MKKDKIFIFLGNLVFLLLLYVFLFFFIILIMSTYYGHIIIQTNPLYILLLFQISWKHCPRRILWVVDHHLCQVSKLIRCNGFVLEYLNVKKWHLRKWFSSRLKLGKICFLCLWSCMRILTFAHSIDPLWNMHQIIQHTCSKRSSTEIIASRKKRKKTLNVVVCM